MFRAASGNLLRLTRMTARAWLSILIAIGLASCASDAPRRAEPADAGLPPAAPAPNVSEQPGDRLAAAAERLVGSPYRFGGSGPRDFDCSGLVYYIHHELALEVPRTAALQFLSATPIPREALQPGDLVFFRDGGDEVTHVGVYIGDGAFVHAPKSGRPVSYARLEHDYFTVNFAGAGRLYPRL